MKWSKEQYQEYLKSNPKKRKDCGACLDAVKELLAEKKHKYNAKSTSINSIKFRSLHEASVYSDLKMYHKFGKIQGFALQPKFDLDNETTWKVDFIVIKNDGSVELIEAKGKETEDYKIKLRLLREKYPHLNLTVIKTGKKWIP